MSLFTLVARLVMKKGEFDKGLGDAEKEAKSSADKIKSAFGAIGKATVAAVGASATAIGALTKKSLDAYGEQEQLVGGIQKLFGNMGMSVEEYAEAMGESVDNVRGKWEQLEAAQTIALQNAKEAYRTAGVSANEYMQSATSFSAALINSLGGDTEEAARVADMAMRDIADNANTFGTYSAQELAGVYQGLAKGMFTTLDNLNLGFGGTKEGMEKLIAKANELKEANGEMGDLSIESFADMVEAIHLVQDSLNITGTTEREAATTIQGSLGMTKAAWQNFVAGLADSEADLDQLISNVVESATSLVNNVLPKIETVLTSIARAIPTVLPTLVEEVVRIATDTLPELVKAAVSLVKGFVNGILKNIDAVIDAAFDIVDTLIDGLFGGDNISKIVTAAFQIIEHLANGLTENIPTLLPAVVEIVTGLLTALTSPDNISSLVDAAIALLMSLADGLISSVDVLLKAVPTILRNLVTAVVENAPKIIKGAIELINQLADGLIDALPDLITIIPGLVMSIMGAIVENAPQLLSAGFELLMQLTFGFWEHLPEFLEQLPQMVQNFADLIVANAPKMIEGGIEAIIQLWEGFIKGMPELINHLPEIIEAIVEGIKSAALGMWDAGKSLVSGLWDGIKNAFSGGSNTEISDGLQPDMEKAEGTAHSASWNIRSAFETNLGSIGSSTTISNSLDTAGAKIEKFASKASKTTDDTFSGLGKSISTSLSSIPKSTSTTFDGVTSGAKTSAETVQNVWKPVPDFFNDIWHKITNTFAETPRYLGTIFANARNSIQSVWSAVPSWFNGIWHSIANAFKTYEAYSWGADMMDNFIRGVQSRMNTLRSAIQSVADTIENLIGFSEPEEGSLANFHTFAPDMMELFAQGVKENEDVVRRQIAESFDFGDLIQGGIGEVTYSTTGAGTVQEQLLGLLSRYLPQLANMQVVMDTGTVVGELRDGMNQSLGEVGRFDKRGMATA